jgi:hypothetical protein
MRSPGIPAAILAQISRLRSASANVQVRKFRGIRFEDSRAKKYWEKLMRLRTACFLLTVFASGAGAVRAQQLPQMAIRPATTASAVANEGPKTKAPNPSNKSCQSPEYRKFDFWVGDWDVHSPNGGPTIGHNLVTVEQDGCLIIEHWKASTANQTGTSFNYYDVRDKKWHQLYLDNSGNAGAFPAMAGNLAKDKMVLISDASQSTVFRWTWYVLEPGKVRQMAEQSSDGQKTWKITWDSVYVKQQK